MVGISKAISKTYASVFGETFIVHLFKKYRNENIAGKTYKRLQVNRKPECNHVVLSLTNSYGCANGKEISRRKTGNATNLCRVILAHPFFA